MTTKQNVKFDFKCCTKCTCTWSFQRVNNKVQVRICLHFFGLNCMCISLFHTLLFCFGSYFIDLSYHLLSYNLLFFAYKVVCDPAGSWYPMIAVQRIEKGTILIKYIIWFISDPVGILWSCSSVCPSPITFSYWIS